MAMGYFSAEKAKMQMTGSWVWGWLQIHECDIRWILQLF